MDAPDSLADLTFFLGGGRRFFFFLSGFFLSVSVAALDMAEALASDSVLGARFLPEDVFFFFFFSTSLASSVSFVELLSPVFLDAFLSTSFLRLASLA